MIDYVCFSGDLEGRVCESTTHLHEFFEDPVAFAPGPDGAVRYVAPKAPGFAKFEAKSAGVGVRTATRRSRGAVGKLHARARRRGPRARPPP
ncbi:L-fuconate dehydratase [Aureococcus anophagefferens]|nr:L-fuconate dehydratase [Aureococcus anophagefferens]